jgi:hypothetical protein
MAEAPRRFPASWRADKIPGGYVVRDATGQAIAFVYSRDGEAEARQAKVLTTDEARRVAANIRAAAGATREGGHRLRAAQKPEFSSAWPPPARNVRAALSALCILKTEELLSSEPLPTPSCEGRDSLALPIYRAAPYRGPIPDETP